MFIFCLLLLLWLPNVFALRDHHQRHGGYLKEIILCTTSDGKLYYYKGKGKEPFTKCEIDIAKGFYANTINETGWALLDIEVNNDKIAEHLQGYAVGFVEGRATRQLIQMHITNTINGYCRGQEEYCEHLKQFLRENLAYMQKEIAKNPTDLYWRHVNISINQVYGMIDGYEDTLQADRTNFDIVSHPIYFLQLAGDLFETELKFNFPKHYMNRKRSADHCSALVRINDANTDIIFSHVTWFTYSSLLRFIKRYHFKLHNSPGTSYTFSGYPGTINSIDDFLLSSAQLAILETTIEVYDQKLMKLVTPQSIFTWIRTQIATRLAKNTEDWVMAFARHNSGTYNNQFVIVDYKLFKPGMKKLKRGLIRIIEQLPGFLQTKDITSHLSSKRHWPSYNRAYFPSVFKRSGAEKMQKTYGDWYSYNNTARALIFEREYRTVTDLASMRRLMRYNDFTNDPLSSCDCDPPYSAINSIAARNDLNPKDGRYPIKDLGFDDMGATDVKITNYKLMKTLSFEAVAGPTHDPLPIFSWKNDPFDGNVSHVGQPDEWNFAPLLHVWEQRSLYG